MNRMIRSLNVHARILIGGLLLITAAAPAEGQERGARLELRYQTSDRPGVILLPWETGVSAARTPAHRAYAIVHSDLSLRDDLAVIIHSGTGQGAAEEFSSWRTAGGQWVVRTEVRPAGDLLRARIQLLDVSTESVHKEWLTVLPAEDRLLRMVAHAISDRISQEVTGLPGIASTKILFVAEERGRTELWWVDWDGQNAQQLTWDRSRVLSPAWDPSGSAVAYTSFRGGRAGIYEWNLVRGQRRALAERPGLNMGPAYAPNGREIAWAGTAGGDTEILIADRNGQSRLRQITDGVRSDALAPSFSPDGSQIAFVSNRLGGPHIYVQSVQGGPARVISPSAGRPGTYHQSPEWSPLGNRIAFHVRTGGRNRIAWVRPDGTGAEFLTEGDDSESPSWSPDGRHLVFEGERAGVRGLFILDTNSGRVRRLTTGNHRMPAWSPNLGSQLVTAAK